MGRGSLRLFVAAYPPPEVAERIVHEIHGIDLPGMRRTPVDRVHLTVQFIGDTSLGDLDRTIESVVRSTAGLAAFELTPRGYITLPDRREARVIALETDTPPILLEIKSRLVRRLGHGRARPVDRFRPHLTVLRIGPPRPVPDLGLVTKVRTFPVDAIRLMRSVLKPSGAIHEVVYEQRLDN